MSFSMYSVSRGVTIVVESHLQALLYLEKNKEKNLNVKKQEEEDRSQNSNHLLLK